jgi:hypothetical protein
LQSWTRKAHLPRPSGRSRAIAYEPYGFGDTVSVA